MNKNKDENEVGTPLVDRTDSGNKLPWNEKKEKAKFFASELEPYLDDYYFIEDKYSEAWKDNERRKNNRKQRAFECAEELEHFQTVEGKLKLSKVHFCRERLCPMCAWRLSLKRKFILSSVLEKAHEKEPSARELFLTFTLNDTGIYDVDDIKERVKLFNDSFRKMMRKKKMKEFVLGFFKKFEIEIHDDDMSPTGLRFHVHLHTLLFVKGNYFKRKDWYMTHEEWQKLWKKSCKVSYDPQVSVEAVKQSEEEKAVKEIDKYVTKTDDYLGDIDEMGIIGSEDKYSNLNRNQKIIMILMKALKGARDIAYGGLLKEIKKEIIKDEDEEDDLIHITGKDDGKIIARTIYSKWVDGKRKYYVHKKDRYQVIDLAEEKNKKELDNLVKTEILRFKDNN